VPGDSDRLAIWWEAADTDGTVEVEVDAVRIFA